MKTKTKRILNDVLEIAGLATAIIIIYAFLCLIAGQPL